jgi:hypothetical protein
MKSERNEEDYLNDIPEDEVFEINNEEKKKNYLYNKKKQKYE